MALAREALSNSGAPSTGTLNWSHPGVNPKCVILLGIENGAAGDEIGTPTYGGVTVPEIPSDSPLLHSQGTEDASLHCFVLHSGVPAGTQTVNVPATATLRAKQFICITLSGAADTALEDSATLDQASGVNPQVTLVTGAGVDTYICAVLQTAVNDPPNLTPGGDYTELLEVDFGNQVGSFVERTANGTGGSIAVPWTMASTSAGIIGIAVKEQGGGGTPNLPAIMHYYRQMRMS